MKNFNKQNQNYLQVSKTSLQDWFDRMQKQEDGVLVPLPQALPAVNLEKELNTLFSEWDQPEKQASLLIEEYLWGVRCGVMQAVNVDSCSFASVLAAAKTDEMCEIYSPAKVQYYSDGSRRVIPHNVSVYNTDAKFACYSLIDLKQAKNLFPQLQDVLETLPPETKFLCSPDAEKIRIASQENGERGFSFNAVDADIKSVAFFLGNLRSTFQYIAREIQSGRGQAYCQLEAKNDLDYLNSKISFLCGGSYPFPKAKSMVSENTAQEIQKAYIRQGINGKENFTILIDGSYIADDADINCLVEEDGKDIRICVPASVYRSWGKPFTAAELEIIHAGRTFNFDSNAEKDYFNKINRLRFDRRTINIFAQNNKQQKIINPQLCDEIFKTELEKIFKEDEKLIQSANFFDRDDKAREQQKRERLAEKEKEAARRKRKHTMRDTSGPSRSSIYTR